jgi:hypothetical protein
MKKVTALLVCLLFQPLGHAAWVYFDDGNGSSDDYYESTITPQGKTTVVKTFSAFSIVNRVPLYDAKVKGKVSQLVKFGSEQSSYEFDCKEKTVQLKSRVFYADREGKLVIISYKNNDKVIENDNSDFAKQFQKKPIYSDQSRNLKLMALACK